NQPPQSGLAEDPEQVLSVAKFWRSQHISYAKSPGTEDPAIRSLHLLDHPHRPEVLGQRPGLRQVHLVAPVQPRLGGQPAYDRTAVATTRRPRRHGFLYPLVPAKPAERTTLGLRVEQ